MRSTTKIALASVALVAAAYGQPSFEAASIRANPPRTGFRFATDSTTGGPGTADPALFRCSNCTLATLIGKAFDLQPYQFPGRSTLGENTFDIMAKIPAGATDEDFHAMLQNLLKDRFGLAYHFKDKPVRGYHLVLTRNGPKLKESSDTPRPPADQHRSGPGGGDHNHTGLMNFGGSATFRGDHQSTADLARMLSDQLGVPVDDQTQLQGKYDISLSWSGNAASHAGNHAEGAWGGSGGGSAGHGDHGGGGGGGSPAGSGGSASRPDPTTGPTLFDALQSQLGLKLVLSEQTTARIFIVDHVNQVPTAN